MGEGNSGGNILISPGPFSGQPTPEAIIAMISYVLPETRQVSTWASMLLMLAITELETQKNIRDGKVIALEPAN